MTGEALREMFERMLPLHAIEEACRRLGVQKRERVLDPVLLVFAAVLMGGTEEAGRLAAVVREYRERGGKAVARSASYRWFDDEFLALMRELKQNAVDYVTGMPMHLPGVLRGRKDWRVVDSTVVRLPNALAGEYPGTGTYASLKVHKEYSLGLENVVAWHITPGRRHDAPELVVDEARRGTGLIVDLGYVGFDLLRRCQAFDVHAVVRLKGGWKVYADDSVSAEAHATWIGAATIPMSAAEPLALEGRTNPLDMDVTVGPEDAPVLLRLVGVPLEKEYLYFLTNVPRSTHTWDEIGMLYRLRWSIELDNKLVKSGCQLDEITSEKPVTAEILVHASMISSMLANAICHLDHIAQGAVGEKTVVLKRPPLHAMLVWKCIVTGAYRIAECLTQGADTATWNQRAGIFMHGGADWNWKRKPSAIDQVKGRTRSGRAWHGHRPRTYPTSVPSKVIM